MADNNISGKEQQEQMELQIRQQEDKDEDSDDETEFQDTSKDLETTLLGCQTSRFACHTREKITNEFTTKYTTITENTRTTHTQAGYKTMHTEIMCEIHMKENKHAVLTTEKNQ